MLDGIQKLVVVNMKINEQLVIGLCLIILVVLLVAIYYQTQATYYKQELEYQQMKYEILIKEPRVKNIIESGG